MADALDVLKEMHVAAKSTFQEIESSPPDKQRQLWAKLSPELELHEQMEERFIYDPMSQELRNPMGALQGWHEQHEAQVSQAEQIIERIDQMEAGQAGWIEKVKELKSMLEQHIQQEESQIWPEIRRQWGEDKLQQRHVTMQAAKVAGEAGATVSGAMEKAAQTYR